MTNIQSSVDMFLDGCACSQAVLVPYCNRYGLDAGHAMKLSAGFASGMRMSETCGAITGSFMVLGLHVCGDDCNTVKGRQELYSRVSEFTARFRERRGSTRCENLLGCDVSSEAGLMMARGR